METLMEHPAIDHDILYLNILMAEPGRVLVVDDDPAVRSVLRSALETEGHVVTEAATGNAALTAAREGTPDVVLLDIRLPELDGVEVCRQWKANPRTASIPVILITGLNDRAVRLAGIDAGADEFLAKPIDVEEVRLRVRNAVQTSRRRQAPAPEPGGAVGSTRS